VAVVTGGVMTAAILVPVVGFAVAPTLTDEEFRWVDVGPATEFVQNAPPYQNVSTSQQIGKVTSLAVSGPDPEADRRVFVRYGPKTGVVVPTPSAEESTAQFEARYREVVGSLTPEDFDLIVIWNRCAHLGCPSAFSPGSGGYVCPCHGGAYDGRGLVTAGPPPRPLDRLDVKVVDGNSSEPVPIAEVAANMKPSYKVLIGKPYSIDQEEQPFALHNPGEPVTGKLSYLYPFQ
jgi:Rieske Fe-S protein